MNPDSVPQEIYENEAARDASLSSRLQDVIGRCMSLEVDLHRVGDPDSEGIILAAREKIVEVAARLEIPLRSKVSGEGGSAEGKG